MPHSQETLNFLERVSVHCLNILTGESHGYNIVGNICQIKIISIPYKSFFLLRYNIFDCICYECRQNSLCSFFFLLILLNNLAYLPVIRHIFKFCFLEIWSDRSFNFRRSVVLVLFIVQFVVRL